MSTAREFGHLPSSISHLQLFAAGIWGEIGYDCQSNMELFHKILKTAVEGNASDIHLKIGTPVIFRINRELIAVDAPFPSSEWMKKVVETITPPHLKKRLDEEREVDFSYFVPEI